MQVYIYCIHIAVCGFTTCTWYYDTWPIIMIFFDLNYIGIRHVDAYIHSCWFALCIYVNMYLCIDIVEAVFQPVYFKVFIHSTYHRITYVYIFMYVNIYIYALWYTSVDAQCFFALEIQESFPNKPPPPNKGITTFPHQIQAPSPDHKGPLGLVWLFVWRLRIYEKEITWGFLFSDSLFGLFFDQIIFRLITIYL